MAELHIPEANDLGPMTYHVGRSWSGHPLEDACPCVKEPCGLVRMDDASPTCTEHPVGRAKSIRQMHRAIDCPALPEGDAAGRAMYEAARTDKAASHWRLLDESDRETWRRAAEIEREAR